MAILLSNTIDLDVSKLKKELEHLSTTGPFTTKPLKVISIVPGSSSNDKTEVTLLTAAGGEPTQAQLILAQQILDTHASRNGQDENVDLLSRKQTVIGNSESGTIVFKNNNQDVWKIDQNSNLNPISTETSSLGNSQHSLLSIHTKNITVTSSIEAPTIDALEQRLDVLETDPATKEYVDVQIANLIGGAPSLLDTLNEISQALNNDENFGSVIIQRLDSLDVGLSTEITNRGVAITSIQNLITNEASSRSEEDVLIRGEISQETSFRENADAALNARVLAVETDLQSLESSLNNQLSGLSDVSITSPTLNQVLKYNGTTWTNSTAPATFSGSYNDLTDKPSLATVATSGSYNDLINKPSLATVATSGSYNDLINKPSLATVATSGSYNDLTNKPNLNSITATASNSIGLSINGVAGQTANLLEVKNSSGSTLLSVSSTGVIGSATWNGETISIDKGGTGATSAQMAINLLTQVSGAGSAAVLTKDSITGNATWKDAPGFPSGSVIDYAGTSAPSGWVLCDGSALNTYTNRTLHAVISNTYGGTGYVQGTTDQPNAITTFNVPDLRRRVTVGAGLDSVGNNDNIAAASRSLTHSHNYTMPAHYHSMDGAGTTLNTTTTGSGHSHTHSLVTNTTGGHQHSLGYGTNIVGGATPKPSNFSGTSDALTGSTGDHSHTVSGTIGNASDGTHTHTLTGSIGRVTGGSSGDTTQNLTSDTSNNSNYMILNKIIKL